MAQERRRNRTWMFWVTGLLWALNVMAGSVETQDHRTYHGQIRFGEGGTLSIQPSNGAVVRVPLEEVRLARWDAGAEATSRVPKGWLAEDVGVIQGTAVEKDGAFSLSAHGGASRDTKAAAAHVVCRVLHGDGEVVARVRSVSGTSCVAGVTLRENLAPSGGFALLAVSPTNRLWLQAREAGWQPVQRHDLGPVTLPVWLKLSREERTKQVTAFRSSDGARWEQVGQAALRCRTEPVAESQRVWLPKLYAGLALSGAGTEARGRARLEGVALAVHGLLGAYYADDRFQNLRFTRPDSRVDFAWGLGSPGPDIPPDHFAVRWIGEVEPKYSEAYRFYVDADNDGWLWVDGQPLPSVPFNQKTDPGKEVVLKAGQRYRLKLEFKEGAGAASVRLGWSSARQGLEVIPASQLYHTQENGFPYEEGEVLTNAPLARGLCLRRGSFIAGTVHSAGDQVTRIAFAGQAEFAIPTYKVARVQLRSPARALRFETAQNRAGIFLKNGDFLESELKKLDGGSLTVRSMLFGQRTFSLDEGEVAAVMLHPCESEPAAFEVRLENGSVLQARSLRQGGSSVLVDDTTLGEVAIPESELQEIRHAPGKNENQSQIRQP